MRQDMFDGLVTFVVVADERSFSAAAVRLGVSASAVSQSVSRLEARLGLPLFNRTTRSVSLTEAGAIYLERVIPAVRELNDAGEELGDRVDRPAGLLRLNVERAGYPVAIQDVLRGFLDAYPDIRVEVRIEAAIGDSVASGFDAAIRLGDSVAHDMVAMRIGQPFATHVVASPDYLQRRGVPEHPNDLRDHECIGFRNCATGQIEHWEFEKDGVTIQLPLGERLIINDALSLVQAAIDGIGIAYMPSGYTEGFVQDGSLVTVLTDWSPPLAGLTLFYRDRRSQPSKLRAFIDYLQSPQNRHAPGSDGVIAGSSIRSH